MKANALPDTIQAIIDQAGGFRLNSAFAYVGASELACQCAQAEGEYRSGSVSRQCTQGGESSIQAEVFLRFRVNGRRGRAWTIIIAYEPTDVYTVWLVEGHRGRSPSTMVLACVRDVYCDTLQSVIEEVYDRAIQEHNGGFIPLS